MRHHYRTTVSSLLDELVYGANDGIVTTFAVISGAAGATLGHQAIIILGLANLVADGFSMGASSFLAIRTQADVARAHGQRVTKDQRHALSRSVATFTGFLVAGMLPLVPFVTTIAPGHEFLVSSVSAGSAFFLVGGLRSLLTRRHFFISGLEMLGVGGIAAILAFGVGAGLHVIVN